MDIIKQLSEELKLPLASLEKTIALIDEGNTIPFIARYRKEVTGGMDDQVLRELSEKLSYLRHLEKRKEEIIQSLESLGISSDELTHKLNSAKTLSELEDLYRPYRPKRRTRATIAKEKGLEPLALKLLMQSANSDTPEMLAKPFISAEKEVLDTDTALQGARDILAEMMSDDADVRGKVRQIMRVSGKIASKKSKDEDSVYAQYYDYQEPSIRMPGHRILAVNRGEKEGFLKVSVEQDDARIIRLMEDAFVKPGSPTAEQVALAVQDAWVRLIQPSAERELRNELTCRAQTAAIHVFADNLRQLLMQRPVKGKVTLGVDPGFRTGCKLAVVDENGKVLETGVGHFTIPGQTRLKEEAFIQVTQMIKKHHVTAIAIGNGTASREAESFIASVIKEMDEVQYMIVSEAGASVYSASKLAAEEFPDYDVSLRSAVSIARRMQDPLSELVKIDPKAIGVGQYQHDLKESELSSALDGVVEGCVNSVGVELSSASAALLTHVAGIGPSLAKNIVAYRDENGFKSRSELKKVAKLGPRAYEQCAGFLRLHSAKNPLDATAVHPESYKAAEALLIRLGYELKTLKKGAIQDIKQRADAIGIATLSNELAIGIPTLNDILLEIQKPGRDPRDDLPAPVLRKDVLDMKDLHPGMELTGTVRNVIDFGVFVDIGVHQDGLVHISRMANRFIRHPSEVVKVGDVISVYVVEVDEKKGRISLTMLKSSEH